VAGIAGCRAAVSARIDLFGLGGRAQVGARFGDLPTRRTSIEGWRLGFLLFRGLGHKKSPYRLPCFPDSSISSYYRDVNMFCKTGRATSSSRSYGSDHDGQRCKLALFLESHHE
jgi:hypothetical protein